MRVQSTVKLRAVTVLMLLALWNTTAYGNWLTRTAARASAVADGWQQKAVQKFITGATAVTLACGALACGTDNVADIEKQGIAQHIEIAELLTSGRVVVISGQHEDIDLDELRATLAAVDPTQLRLHRDVAIDRDALLTALRTALAADDVKLLKLENTEMLVSTGDQVLLFPYAAAPGLLHPLAAGVIVFIGASGLVYLFGNTAIQAFYMHGLHGRGSQAAYLLPLGLTLATPAGAVLLYLWLT